jgi:glycosyltransferase involved in cell wall biosynthesis
MLCYHYAPGVSGGVERSVRFARHLPEFGWTPLVLTTNRWGAADGPGEIVRTAELLRRARPGRGSAFGAGGARQAADTASWKGAGPRGPLRRFAEKWLLVPDKHVRWTAAAFPRALGLLREGRADAIYTTSPPASAHLLGLALARLTGKPWIADLRDPWTLEPLGWFLRAGGARLSLERRLERSCFDRSSAIVASTPEAAVRYEEIYPASARKVHAIPNGYDAAEIEEARASVSRCAALAGVGDDVFVMSHTGTFFRHTDVPAFPKGLLDAVAALAREGRLSPRRFRLVFAGSLHPEAARAVASYDLGALVSMTGPVAHIDALRIMARSDLLFLYDPNREARYYVHGKLYEYLAAGKPILGVLPHGAARRLLERSGRGIALVGDDEREVRPAVVEAMSRRDGPAAAHAAFDVSRYEARRLTAALADILEKVCRG